MNPWLVAFAILIIGIVASVSVLAWQGVVLYDRFQVHFTASQILETELQHRHNDTNITLEVYEPPIGGVPF